MSQRFFTSIKTKLSYQQSRVMTDEQVKAFLHHTEVQYKQENRLIPISHHREEYEAYVLSQIHEVTRSKLAKYEDEYTLYKSNQNLKIEAAKYLEGKIFPLVKEFSYQQTMGFHGLEHTELVALRAIDISIANNHRDMHQHLIPVMLAAALHDSARTNDLYNNEHGPKAAHRPESKAFLDNPEFALSEEQKRLILDAVAHHTDAMPHLFAEKNFIKDYLCDADRVRLSWQIGHDPKYFFTKVGNELGTMTPYRVIDYLHGWDYLFEKGKIKTISSRPLQSRYSIRYSQRTKHNQAYFIDPSYQTKQYTL